MTPDEALPPSFRDPLLESFRAALVRRWKPFRKHVELEVAYEARAETDGSRGPDEWIRLVARAGHRKAWLELVERRIVAVDVRIRARCVYSIRRAHVLVDGASVLSAFERTAGSLVTLGPAETERRTVDSIGDAWASVINAPDAPPP